MEKLKKADEILKLNKDNKYIYQIIKIQEEKDGF